jgi:hypothetical protein
MDKESLANAPVRLQLRVRQPLEEPVYIEVRSGDNLVFRKGEPYARPGEMVTVQIPTRAYEEVSQAEALTVAIVKRRS